ncbi:MAG TPA: hypothetical protein VIM65_21465 [Cyclobacteriaceae bacterium]
MKNFSLIFLISIVLLKTGYAQKRDTVIVELAKTSKVIFTIQDKKDLEILKHYDFQKLFQDVITNLEKRDSSTTKKDSVQTSVAKTESEDDNKYWHKHEGNDDDDEDDDNDDGNWNHKHWRRTSQSFNFDQGMNNYVSKGKFPDSKNEAYAVKPWGSWYFAVNSVQRSRLGKNFFMEWGAGVSWYNFKFQNSNTIIQKDDTGVSFTPDTRGYDYIKSKLTATYINASLIPVIDFGDHHKKHRVWDGESDSFRIGLGPYVGYRIASHSKLVYKDDGHREKDKNRDSFYLNNIRYGARLQLGIRSTDFFFNYDMNELFANGKGPKLNAFSFGVIF